MSNKVSDLEDFKTVGELKKEITQLKYENRAALATIDKLLVDLNKKAEEIDHLKSLVTQVVPVIQAPKGNQIIIAPEAEVADSQLERLRQASKNRTLTLEEVRMYDLLVKNKRLSQDKPQAKASYRDVSDSDLELLVEKLPKNESRD